MMSKPPGKKGKHAFTLLELMVVLALIGIMSAMVIPEMRGTYENAILRSTSRKLVGAFNLAYSRAVSVNKQYRVRLDRSEGKYFIESVAPNGEFIPTRGIPDTEGKLDDRVTISIRQSTPESLQQSDSNRPAATDLDTPTIMPDADVVVFYPDGTCDNREVQLQDREGFRLSLKLNPITSRVRVVETERRN